MDLKIGTIEAEMVDPRNETKIGALDIGCQRFHISLAPPSAESEDFLRIVIDGAEAVLKGEDGSAVMQTAVDILVGRTPNSTTNVGMWINEMEGG